MLYQNRVVYHTYFTGLIICLCQKQGHKWNTSRMNNQFLSILSANRTSKIVINNSLHNICKRNILHVQNRISSIVSIDRIIISRHKTNMIAIAINCICKNSLGAIIQHYCTASSSLCKQLQS